MTELGELRKHYAEIAARGVDVLAVSVEPPEIAERLRRKLATSIRFLCDERGDLMDTLHIRDRDALPPGFVTGRQSQNGGRDLFMSTSFLLDSAGAICWIYRPETYRVRAPAREVLAAIDRLG